MSSMFFAFEDFDVEINKKLSTLHFPSNLLLDELLITMSRLCRPQPGEPEIQEVREFVREILNTQAEFEYKDYLNHPIRVAASFHFIKDYQIDGHGMEETMFALAHNAEELGILDSLNLGEFYRLWVHKITIDRTRERDVAYRKEFYDAIEEHSSELLRFKALDKLDNTFWWVMMDLETYHIDVVLEEVCPRLTRYDAKLASYLSNLVEYVLRTEVKNSFRLQYKS